MKKNLLKYSWLIIMALTLGFTSCGDPEVEEADKAALITKITEAEGIVSEAVVGKLAGEYPQTAVDALQTAIDAAKAINEDAEATQAQVDATVANLQLAIEAFEALVNVEISAENLVAYWKMDGDGADASGNSHDGTLKSGLTSRFPDAGALPVAATDRFGNADKALKFAHGSNIEVPYSVDLNPDQLTVSLWLKADSLIAGSTQYLMSLNIWNSWKFELPDHGKPFLTRKLSDDSHLNYDSNPVALSPDTWYHVVVATDQTSWVFYIDGTQAVEYTLENNSMPIASTDVNFVIGSFLPNDAEWDKEGWFTSFYGTMDDGRIYDKKLSAAEVTALYTMEKVD